MKINIDFDSQQEPFCTKVGNVYPVKGGSGAHEMLEKYNTVVAERDALKAENEELREASYADEIDLENPPEYRDLLNSAIAIQAALKQHEAKQ